MEAAEQRVGQVKDMCDKIFDELSVRGEDAVGAGFVAASNATNKLVFEGGFSSNQWVLGQQVRLPASLLDPEARLVEHGNALESTKCWERVRLREVASAAIFRTDNETRLRSALLSRARRSRGPFEVGQLVHKYRTRGLRRERESEDGTVQPGLVWTTTSTG